MADELDKEYRAWELLRWSTPAPIAPFDERLADAGFYTKAQRQRSDAALTAAQTHNTHNGLDTVAVVELKRDSPRTELEAFRELMRLGVLSEETFYSPDKAAGRPRKLPGSEQTKPTEETYLDRYKRHKRETEQAARTSRSGNGKSHGSTQATRFSGLRPARGGSDASNAESSRMDRTREGRQGHRPGGFAS